MRVLLFGDDIPGSTPQALRLAQLKEGLEFHGVEVLCSFPDFGPELPDDWRSHAWRIGSQKVIIDREKPDAILFSSSWEHQLLENKPEQPVIVDLFGSRMQFPLSSAHTPSAEQKLHVMANADCLLTASAEQRQYFAGWLVQAGIVPEARDFIRVVPPAVYRKSTVDKKLTRTQRVIVEDGWSPYLVWNLLQRFGDKVGFDILGQPGEEEPDLAVSSDSAFNVYRKICEYCEYSGPSRLYPDVERDLLEELTAKAEAGMVLSKSFPELAPCLLGYRLNSLGLPLLIHKEHSLRRKLSPYVAPFDTETLEETFTEFLSGSTVIERPSESYLEMEPLLHFLQAPQVVTERPVEVGSFHARPCYLSTKSQTSFTPLPLDGFSQEFILPAEDLAAIQIAVEAPNGGALKLELSGEEFICSKRVSELPPRGLVSLKLPLWPALVGGRRMKLKIRPLEDCDVSIRTSSVLDFPLVEDSGRNSQSKLSGIHNGSKAFIALEFVPGEASNIHKVKVLTRRAYRMVRQGDWKRFYRAVAWRASQVWRGLSS